MTYRNIIKLLLHKAGFEIIRYEHTLIAHRLKLLSHYGINLIQDRINQSAIFKGVKWA